MRTVENPFDKQTEKCTGKTYFSLIGYFDPQDITDLLRVNPDYCWKVNDLINSKRTFADSAARRMFSKWVYGTSTAYNGDFNRQIKTTIKNIVSKADLIKELVDNHSVKAYIQIECDVTADGLLPNFSIDKEIIEFCYKSGTVIDSDMSVF